MSKTDSQTRRGLLQGGAAAAFAAGLAWPATKVHAQDEDQEGLHGMLVVGQQTVFLSHLGMFQPPHHYQAILQASFAKPGRDPQADYFNDRKRTGAKIYTLEPELFVLPMLVAPEPLRSFKATIYREHFERFANPREKDAARIGRDVDVTVTKVVHFRKFDPAAAKLRQLEYLLFGKGDELFLAHLITRPPDFDQILSVKVLNQTFTDEELAKGVPIAFPGKANSVSQRIRGAQAVTGQLKGAAGAAPRTVQLQPGTEFYNETGDFKTSVL